MPYKSQKIIIANTEFDRRIKLDDDQKEQIRNKWKQGQSIHGLSREYKVDRQVIRYTIFPERYEKMKLRNKEYAKTYEIPTEKSTTHTREHRRYKQKLHVEGKI